MCARISEAELANMRSLLFSTRSNAGALTGARIESNNYAKVYKKKKCAASSNADDDNGEFQEGVY